MTDSELSALTRAALFYDDVIDEHLATGFVERSWLAARIERHFRDPQCRFVLLFGGPGAGKSTVMAWLARRHDLSPRYFLRKLSSTPLAEGDARSLLLSVGNQLAELRPGIMGAGLDVQVQQAVGDVRRGGRLVGVTIDVLKVSPFRHTAMRVEQHADRVAGDVVGVEVRQVVEETRSLALADLQNFALLEPAARLAAADPDALVVVLIDALDELRFRLTASSGRGDILDWLAECPELPPNLRVVISSRPDLHLLRRFRLAQAERIREEVIEPTAEEVRRDLLALARQLLADPVFADLPAVRATGAASLAERIAGKADGNFLYLTLWGAALREAAEAGDDDRLTALTDLSVLPSGLDGIYEYFLTLVTRVVEDQEGRRWRHRWKQVYQPLLDALALARGPVSTGTLLLLGGLTARRRDAAEALEDLGQFLIEDRAGLRLCHLSLAEFLTSAEDRRAMDHWHVDADENHYLIAQRLVSRYGDAWETCTDDYALDHTAAHLVAAIRDARSPEVRDSSAASLTDLLAAPAYGVAKSRRFGVDPVLGDYLGAHEVLDAEPARAAIAAGLSDVLARLVDEGVPDLAETLHAVVGYRTEANGLNREVLARLTDPAYLRDAVVDESRRSAALIAFSHGQATRLRRTGVPDDLEQAHRMLREAVAAIDDIDRVTSARQRSSMLYELAYLEFLHGHHEQAAEWFARCVEAAEAAGDRAAAAFSRLVGLRIALLGGTAEPDDYRAAHEEALALFTGGEVSSPHLARWTAVVHEHLLDLALWTRDVPRIVDGLAVLIDDPWIRDSGRTDILDKYRARAAVVTGDWTTAEALFRTILEDHLGDPPSHREELARDLFYYGHALAGSGDEAGARRVWELGLRCPDNAGNWPWKPRVAEALRALDA